MKLKSVKVFTDGSSIGNSAGSHAGWCFYLPDYKIRCSAYIVGTNNIAELTAIKQAFSFLRDTKKRGVDLVYDIINMYTDSKYCIGAIVGKNKVNANKELIAKIKTMIDEIKNMGKQIFIHHIDAHTGENDYFHKANDVCDKEAKRQAKTEGHL